MQLPGTWQILEPETRQDYFCELTKFIEAERREYRVFPPADQVFCALEATPLDKVKVLLLGQDPYHGEGQAHGLCFSVCPGVKVPPSLRNIYKELEDDLGIEAPSSGYLMRWAEQGVLMLNTVLTVRANEANSHRRRGWEEFTDAAICAVNDKSETVVFVLWGSPAKKKKKLIDMTRHVIIESAHPSPLSASRGFFGSSPFSRINQALRGAGREPIDWEL